MVRNHRKNNRLYLKNDKEPIKWEFLQHLYFKFEGIPDCSVCEHPKQQVVKFLF